MDSSFFNRLIIGLVLVTTILISYFSYLDHYLMSIIILFVTFDLYNIKVFKKYFIYLFLLSLFLIYIFLPFNFLKFTYVLEILIILSIIISNKFKKILFLLFCLILIYLISADRNIFYTLILISFLNDTMAYIFGKTLRGPLILPSISPKKTWSGTISSFLITTIVLYLLKFNIYFSAIISISLFFGDILLSHIKRYLMLKDFSSLLGSHGGILDRLDSMFLVAILFQIYLLF